MLLQMALFHSFLWLSNSPLNICTTSLSFFCQWAFRLRPCLGYCTPTPGGGGGGAEWKGRKARLALPEAQEGGTQPRGDSFLPFGQVPGWGSLRPLFLPAVGPPQLQRFRGREPRAEVGHRPPLRPAGSRLRIGLTTAPTPASPTGPGDGDGET